MKRFFIFLLMLSQVLFAQTQSDNSSFFNKLELFFGPQYTNYTQSLNILNIKDQKYLDEPINGSLFFGTAHILGLVSGVRGYDSQIYVYFHANLAAYSPAADLKNKYSGSVISGINMNQFVEYGMYGEHFFGSHFGFGIEYREVTENYTSFAYPGYADLLRMNLSKKLVYISIPYKYTRDRSRFMIKAAFAPFLDYSKMNYQFRFNAFGDPSAPTTETGPALPMTKIKNHPYAFYIEAGLSMLFLKHIPIKLLYRFDYEWAQGYYSKHVNSLNLVVGIPAL